MPHIECKRTIHSNAFVLIITSRLVTESFLPSQTQEGEGEGDGEGRGQTRSKESFRDLCLLGRNLFLHPISSIAFSKIWVCVSLEISQPPWQSDCSQDLKNQYLFIVSGCTNTWLLPSLELAIWLKNDQSGGIPSLLTCQYWFMYPA